MWSDALIRAVLGPYYGLSYGAGVVLNVVVLVIGRHSSLKDQDYRGFVDAIAIANTVSSLIRGFVRTSLVVVDDLGALTAPICTLSGFMAPFGVIITVISVHPLFLHRYLAVCRPEWSRFLEGKLRRFAVALFPFALGIGISYRYFQRHFRFRFFAGMFCKFQDDIDRVNSSLVNETVFEPFHAAQKTVYFGSLATHFLLVAFYTIAVRRVIGQKKTFQMSRSDWESVKQTEGVMRAATAQAVGPLVLYTPLLGLIGYNFLGYTTSIIPTLVVIVETFYLTPIWSAVAVLLLLKPYRRVVCRKTTARHDSVVSISLNSGAPNNK